MAAVSRVSRHRMRGRAVFKRLEEDLDAFGEGFLKDHKQGKHEEKTEEYEQDAHEKRLDQRRFCGGAPRRGDFRRKSGDGAGHYATPFLLLSQAWRPLLTSRITNEATSMTNPSAAAPL